MTVRTGAAGEEESISTSAPDVSVVPTLPTPSVASKVKTAVPSGVAGSMVSVPSQTYGPPLRSATGRGSPPSGVRVRVGAWARGSLVVSETVTPPAVSGGWGVTETAPVGASVSIMA